MKRTNFILNGFLALATVLVFAQCTDKNNNASTTSNVAPVAGVAGFDVTAASTTSSTSFSETSSAFRRTVSDSHTFPDISADFLSASCPVVRFSCSFTDTSSESACTTGFEAAAASGCANVMSSVFSIQSSHRLNIR